jgi:putative redox protein
MIRADSQPSPFLTHFTNAEQVAWSDATLDKGGAALGFRPHELLEAALASCMNITLRMYAKKHEIPLDGVSVLVCLDRRHPEEPTFVYRVELAGALSDAQKTLLLSVAEQCPVHTTLSKHLRFTRDDAA